MTTEIMGRREDQRPEFKSGEVLAQDPSQIAGSYPSAAASAVVSLSRRALSTGCPVAGRSPGRCG